MTNIANYADPEDNPYTDAKSKLDKAATLFMQENPREQDISDNEKKQPVEYTLYIQRNAIEQLIDNFDSIDGNIRITTEQGVGISINE